MTNEKAIVSIEVDRLFGSRSYRIPSAPGDIAALSRLFILYGDNGSGKTTLLRMLFALLSTARKRGDKNYLASVPFRRFVVRLADGSELSAWRDTETRAGSYNMGFETPVGELLFVHLPVSQSGEVALTNEGEATLLEIYEEIGRLGLALYYVSDTRELRTSITEAYNDVNVQRHSEFTATRREILLRRRSGRETRDERLETAVSALEQWARQQTLRRSTVGEQNANTIYGDVVRRIAQPQQKARGAPAASADELRSLLLDLTERTASFSDLGLVSRFDPTELLAAIDGAPAKALPIVKNVIEPHIDGLLARLAAMQELKDVLSTFVANINALYTRKSVSFHVRRGLTIRTEDGREISPTALSSGERQLLLLLCNTLVAREQPSIFIIDEPEISLNVKWQRRLVSTLLESVSGSPVQFILATHSIELLARQRMHVAPLEAGEML